MEGRRGSNQYQQKVDVPILAQAEPGTKTREIAAKAVDMKQGERTDLSQICGKLSQPEAAGLLNVGERTVDRASRVLSHGTPELVEAVEKEKFAMIPLI